jgi:hypothetical protein
MEVKTSMKYPTMEEVVKATKEQLGQWVRFLPSPGENAMKGNLSNEIWVGIMNEEQKILMEIMATFDRAGGWNPRISKDIGWDQLRWETP